MPDNCLYCKNKADLVRFMLDTRRAALAIEKAFLPVKGWIMVIFFMCLGISLKFIPGVHTEFFASFYPGLGTALIVAGATFLANWINASAK